MAFAKKHFCFNLFCKHLLKIMGMQFLKNFQNTRQKAFCTLASLIRLFANIKNLKLLAMYPIYTYYYLSGILLTLVVLKTILYVGSTSRHNLSNWFFFNTNALYNSRNTRSRKLKVWQNRLTMAILIIAAVDTIAILLF